MSFSYMYYVHCFSFTPEIDQTGIRQKDIKSIAAQMKLLSMNHATTGDTESKTN